MGNVTAIQITRLFGDSTKFDFSAFYGQMDMIFVDGGHDLPTVKSDTENALRMLSDRKPSAIVWHDYMNPTCGPLHNYLDELSRTLPLVHPETSWMVYCLNR